MVSPDTIPPPPGGYAKVLDLIQTLSQCENCQAFKGELEQSLETQYGLCIRLKEHAGSPALSGRKDLSRQLMASPEGAMPRNSIVLAGPAGWKLEISPVSDKQVLEDQFKILTQIHHHLANLYHQYKVIELLERTLKTVKKTGEKSQAEAAIDLDQLTPRERQIVAALVDGSGNAEISNKLNISPRTVEKHLENIFRKLHLENRYQLITTVSHATA